MALLSHSLRIICLAAMAIGLTLIAFGALAPDIPAL